MPSERGCRRALSTSLERALRHYGVESLERTPALERACYRLFLSQERADASRAAVTAILDHRLERSESLIGNVGDEFREVLDRLIAATEDRDQVVADLARDVRYRYYDEPVIEAAREQTYAAMEEHLRALGADPEGPDREARMQALVECPRPLAPWLTGRIEAAEPGLRRVLIETMARRYYRVRELARLHRGRGERPLAADHRVRERRAPAPPRGRVHRPRRPPGSAEALAAHAADVPAGEVVVADIYAAHGGETLSHDELAARLQAALAQVDFPASVDRLVVAVAEPRRGRGMSAVDLFTFRLTDGAAPVEDESLRGLHPMMAERLRLWRFANFSLERLPSAEDVYLFRGARPGEPQGRAAVRDRRGSRPDPRARRGRPRRSAARVRARCCSRRWKRSAAIRFISRRAERPLWNRIVLYAWPTLELSPEEIRSLVARNSRATAPLGIEMVLLYATMPDGRAASGRACCASSARPGSGVVVEVDDPPTDPLQPLDEPAQRLLRRGVGATCTRPRSSSCSPRRPRTREADQPSGEFVEHDLDPEGPAGARRPPPGDEPDRHRRRADAQPQRALPRRDAAGEPVRRSRRGRSARSPSRSARGSSPRSTSPRSSGVPAEWFALSAGAKIAMDSGTENMDWIAAVLRRIVEFTQAGGELNVVITGINVGAQPYWNAEATMLMHTRGILVMTPESAMVLTGKQALDYSGGVSAEDNFGIGGYERIMGPNGQAQYWAARPRRTPAGCCSRTTSTPTSRRASASRAGPRPPTRSTATCARPPHSAPDSDLRRVGEIFSDATNPGRKKPFDIRSVMRRDGRSDHPPLERWAAMRDAEIAVVWEAHLGGWPVMLLGIESRPLGALRAGARRRPRPVDVGHPVPALVEEDRPRDQRRRRHGGRWSCSPTCRASTARRSRCISGSSSTARRSGARWSTSTGRSSSASSRATTAAPSSSSPRGSTTSSRRRRSRDRTRR